MRINCIVLLYFHPSVVKGFTATDGAAIAIVDVPHDSWLVTRDNGEGGHVLEGWISLL